MSLAELPRLDVVPLRQPEPDFDPWPDIDPGEQALLYRIIVQLKRVPLRTKGGIHLTDDHRENQQVVEKIAKVVSVGALAYHTRATGQPWPGYPDAYPQVGDFVRVRTHGGERLERDGVMFVVYDDLDLVTKLNEVPD